MVLAILGSMLVTRHGIAIFPAPRRAFGDMNGYNLDSPMEVLEPCALRNLVMVLPPGKPVPSQSETEAMLTDYDMEHRSFRSRSPCHSDITDIEREREIRVQTVIW
ncbi:hypothetical protein F4778DRAFT_764908 [Xylariomycetidae sp. FL2044]|nr:hypothetical protein F4778DRAFT_764908 [Xylariomycetidae sp. FL2044]